MIAVAALSARAIVEMAARDGQRCVALDVFGDVDTRRTAARWHPVGSSAGRSIDGSRLLDALRALAREGRTAGWVAGSGFEHQPEVLAAGAGLLPLLGTAGDDVQRLRDPRQFFAFLDEAGIAHPPVAFVRPAGAGWLLKDGGGAGGWHVRRADDPKASPGPLGYWQRERAAVPMSATFVANGRDATVLGFNRQRVAAMPGRPYVFRGIVGPVTVSAAVRKAVGEAASRAATHFALRGLGSIDFLLHEGRAEVLEINPRPPASLVLYPRVGAAGPMHAHRRACTTAALPLPVPPGPVRGMEIVFARRPLTLGATACARLADMAATHDLPSAGTAFTRGDPVCSLSAEGPDADAVEHELDRRCEALHSLLETPE